MFKIFVGNLDYKVRPEQVRELFTLYAPIEDLVIPTDPKTNKPRGFAIVMIRDPELGAAAVRGVQGKRLMGRELVVNEAVKKKGKTATPAPGPGRTGPFGPRLFRMGESRSRGSRNPRRSTSSGSSSGPGGGPPPVARPANPPSVASPLIPVPTRGATGPLRPAATANPDALADRPSSEAPKAPLAKARPKSPPSSPSAS